VFKEGGNIDREEDTGDFQSEQRKELANLIPNAPPAPPNYNFVGGGVGGGQSRFLKALLDARDRLEDPDPDFFDVDHLEPSWDMGTQTDSQPIMDMDTQTDLTSRELDQQEDLLAQAILYMRRLGAMVSSDAGGGVGTSTGLGAPRAPPGTPIRRRPASDPSILQTPQQQIIQSPNTADSGIGRSPLMETISKFVPW